MSYRHESQIELLMAAAAMWRAAEKLHDDRMHDIGRPLPSQDELRAMSHAIELTRSTLQSMDTYLKSTLAIAEKATTALG